MDEPRATTDAPEDVEDVGSEYVPLSDLVTGLVVNDGQIVDEEVGLVVTLDKLATDFPVELRLEHGDDGMRITTAPPTQHVETTVLPVWHQLRVTITRETEDDDGDAA